MRPRVKDWLKWVAAGFALAATASAEYDLARAIGMNEWIAMAVPGALDAYVVRALRAHREVLTAVLAMVGVNAASHLVTAGILAVDWRLITAVSAIAPLVLWRVHALSTPDEHGHAEDTEEHDDERAYEHDPGDHQRARTEAQTCSHGCQVWGDLGAHERAHVLAGWNREPFLPGDVLPCVSCSQPVTFTGEHGWVHNPGYDAPCVLKDTSTDDGWISDEWRDWSAKVEGWHERNDTPEDLCPCGHEHARHTPACTFVHADPENDAYVACSCTEYRKTWAPAYDKHDWDEHVSTAVGVSDYVPDMSTLPLPVREPGAALDGHVPEWQRPPLTVVPPLPEGYEHDEHGVLQPGDVPFKSQARVLDSKHRSEHGKPVPVRVLKSVLGVGTPRAQRLCAFLLNEHASTQEASTDADRD